MNRKEESNKVAIDFNRAMTSHLRNVTRLRSHKGFDPDKFLKNFTCLPNQYAYLLNYTNMKLHWTQNFKEILGYAPEEFTTAKLFEIVYPDDREQYAQLAKSSLEFARRLRYADPFEYLFSLDYRVTKANGQVIRIMRQATTYNCDNEGRFVDVLSICTDITKIKPIGPIQYSMMNCNGKEFKLSADQHNKCTKPSPRELEILNLVAEGLTNIDISARLHISRETVRNHRKNLLDKTNCKNTPELMLCAFQNGWL